jgi:HEPN domain-containing protein
MKDETRNWLRYADENYRSGKILTESGLFNPALQNIQQAMEKSLKALFIEKGIPLQKTHSIGRLITLLEEKGFSIELELEKVELVDSIYLTSKYPVGSVLPDFHPDENLCIELLEFARHVLHDVEIYLRD